MILANVDLPEPFGPVITINLSFALKFILSNIDKILNILSDREHDLIRMIFGIGMDPVDPKIVAEMFGVCGERIRQMKETALKKLRKIE